MSSILDQTGRQTLRREVGLIVVPVKAAAIIRAGFMVCVDATGFAVEGKAATGLTYLGRAEEHVDATGFADGDLGITVTTGNANAFLYANSAADPVTQASFGKPCYIEDGETVAETDTGGTLSPAGRVVGIDENGVWVE
ncbi:MULTISPECIES: hypothetical protein [Acinetobacter]|uniref:Uncharacterized protein n=1 Tax=Acinetobacter ursingii TaxID=108980 RepID=A0A7T9Z5T6_9GAMM|nr:MULTISPECIES: hypothetical protein [Acinetobacter]ENX46651.1 hypothetical protein F943_02992 [Acinetobacter ursingii NIPH 706]EXD35753.1 hypothetical protein J500_1879 [Acinetobacter sp. 479375]MCU4524645.1 hypothetical protein [Acinetobacter ursingii]QQT85209.1 hypothetical protein I6I53_09690 [Acinetobacter ursingii]RSO82864.1 hypothetical protein EA748_07875 [Acinetobacter ursingii]